MTESTTSAPPPTSPTPPLSGQDINLAASATRRLLLVALGPLDATFEQWTVINGVGSGRVASEHAMAALLRTGLAFTDPEIEDLFAGMAGAGLVERGDALTLTARGHDLFDQGSAIVAALVADLYAGFLPEDLARTREILVEVTSRAEARLSSAA